MKPLIGITAEINPATNMCEVNHEYALAVAAAGGTPVMLAPLSDSPSYVEDVLASLDGVLLSGGGDISPRAYGETLRHPSILGVNEQRDYFELQLARRAFVLNMPTLGICRGLQIMNVALGGTLYQDLALIEGIADEQALLHRQPKPYERGQHEVNRRSTPYTAKSTPNKRTTPCRSSSIPCTIRQFAILPLCLK